MPSRTQIEANRRNALKSTGPRTPEGKANSARNALQHGLASISPLSFLAIEDRSAFERMLHGYILKYQPAHADEVDLLTDAVFCKWRQHRLWIIEAQAIEMDVAEHQLDLQTKLPKANAAAHVAHAVIYSLHHSRAHPLNRRYEAQLHRQYLRNLKELQNLQSARAAAKAAITAATNVSDESADEAHIEGDNEPETPAPNKPNSPTPTALPQPAAPHPPPPKPPQAA